MKKFYAFLITLSVFFFGIAAHDVYAEENITDGTTGVISENEPVNGSIWATMQPVVKHMSDGIVAEYGFVGEGYEKYVVDGKERSLYFQTFSATYTIPEDYDKEELVISVGLLEAITEYYERFTGEDSSFISMPGDNYRVIVKIINNSKYEYDYDENSFVVYPDNEIESYISYQYDKIEIDNEVISEEGVLFNDEAVRVMNQYTRVGNLAIKALVGDGKDITDEALDPLLKSAGYNGIEDLGKYCLDYYNNYYGTNYTSLDSFSIDQMKSMMRNSISKVVTQTETNGDLIALHFNYFYNVGISIGVGDTDEVLLTDDRENQMSHSVGEYMRDETLGDEYIQENFGKLTNEKENEGTFTVHLSGPDLENVYALYDFMTHSYMTFTAPKGKVIVRYVENINGTDLISPIELSGMVGKNYATEEKIFEGYELDEIEGNVTGEYVDGTLYVTYIYEYVLGEGGEDVEEGTENPSVPEIPQTGIDMAICLNGLSTISVLAISLFTIRKKLMA